MKTSSLDKLIPVMCALPCLAIGLQVEGAAGVVSALAMEIGTTMLGKVWSSVKEQRTPSKYVDEEIQNALIDAFADALQTLEVDFNDLPVAYKLSKESRETVKLVFEDLRKQGHQILTTSRLHVENEQSFEDFLLDKSPDSHEELINQLEDSGLWQNLIDHEQSFVKFIFGNFVSYWQRSFLRRVKDDNNAFNAFMLKEKIEERHERHIVKQTLQSINEGVGQLRQQQLAQTVHILIPRNKEEYFFPHQYDVLDELNQALQPARKIVLTGPQGVGKTLTALEYARRLQSEEKDCSMFWIGAESESQFLDELVGLAPRLGVNISTPSDVRLHDRAAQQQAAARQVRDRIAQLGNWLLIIDNLDGWLFASKQNEKAIGLLEDILPSPLRGRVLITSCDRPGMIEGINGYQALELKEMNIADGARFLLQRTGYKYASQAGDDETPASAAEQQVWGDAMAISKSVSGLPLALDQAAAYVKQTKLGLGDYLRIYRQEGQHFITQDAYTGSHQPVVATFSVALKRLQESSEESARLAGDLLMLFAILAPNDISLQMAEIALATLISERAEQTAIDWDTFEVLQEAHNLRLLNYDPHLQMVSLHQVVYDVIWEIICSQEEELYWLTQAAGALAIVFETPAVSNAIVYPHVHALSLRIELLETRDADLALFWQQLRSLKGGERLWEMMADIQVLAAIENGARWELLLLGTEDPSYSDLVHSVTSLHTVEDPLWLERSEHMLASISRVCSPNRARNIFLCLAMLVHYWWSSYMPDEPIIKPLLDIWQRTHSAQKDQKLVEKLRYLFDKYPAELEERLDKVQGKQTFRFHYQWEAVRKTCVEIREMLKTDVSEAEQDTPSFRYASAMLNMYEAQARTAVLPTSQEPDEEALKLLYEAEDMLWFNADFFHAVWTIRERGEANFRLAQQHLQLSHRRKSEKERHQEMAAERFDDAKYATKIGIGHQVDMAENQGTFLDLELLANLFRLRADIVWQVDQNWQQAGLYWCISLYLAYIWIQDELDAYSVEFFNEFIESTVAWWQELKHTSVTILTEVFEMMSRFWQAPLPSALSQVINNKNWETLRQALLPEGLSRADLLDETAVNTYLQQAAQMEPAMLSRVDELSKLFDDELLKSFIQILKLRTTSDNS